MNQPLIELRGLSKHFNIGRGEMLRAVSDVSFTIERGRTLGMVGESGCGKSTLGRTVLRLHEPTAGEIRFDGEEIGGLSGARLKNLRRRMQMVFQDPYASLNPRLTVRDIVGEALVIHKLVQSKSEYQRRVEELLELVGLQAAHACRYPHEFSGGQRQRIGIARALAISPEFIIFDEPISALDVSVQAQIVNLLKGLQQRLGLTYLFIAHDLAMVKHISDRVAVMYLGKLVEIASSERIYDHPRHPYTQALLSSVPSMDVNMPLADRILLSGEPPSPMNPPSGCHFRTRCPIATELCAEEAPRLREVGPDHWCACHYTEEDLIEPGN
jgi:oligopeptide transport system ATP-binding protein